MSGDQTSENSKIPSYLKGNAFLAADLREVFDGNVATALGEKGCRYGAELLMVLPQVKDFHGIGRGNDAEYYARNLSGLDISNASYVGHGQISIEEMKDAIGAALSGNGLSDFYDVLKHNTLVEAGMEKGRRGVTRAENFEQRMMEVFEISPESVKALRREFPGLKRLSDEKVHTVRKAEVGSVTVNFTLSRLFQDAGLGEDRIKPILDRHASQIIEELRILEKNPEYRQVFEGAEATFQS